MQWHYFIEGEGKDLVFAHGVLGRSRNFRTTIKDLSKDYRCLAYDHRGHGNSFHSEPYTINQLAQDLYSLSEQLHLEKFCLVGNSLGGFMALLFAKMYPEKLDKLIIVDSSPEPITHLGQNMIDQVKSLQESFSNTSEARKYLKEQTEKKVITKDMAGLLSISLKEQDSKTTFCFNKLGIISLIEDSRKHNYWDIIKNLKCPTLYIRGENSTHFSKEDFNKISQSCSLIQGIEIEAAGHWPHHEKPKEFSNAVRKFLNS